ncbi:response regulator [Aquincola sp. S2]|uniref:Response regulator n=1 Tax=Pseudaquabacterium terrae TaxID=2732868 RepID=A0ABX2EC73_9BURK|nr:response regulator [Aquabacterium terrae]NRF65473.1 response regulator [Aquabacterium terrae]
MKILLVEDDLDLSGALTRALFRRGFEVVVCIDGVEALNLTRHHDFDAILLDLSIPGIDGLRVLQRLRNHEDWTPVLVLTARGAVGDRIVGLNAGADDYLAKPFDLDELEARLRALVRRGGSSDELACGALRYDKRAGIFLHETKPLDLSPRESALLKALIARPGHGVTRDRLFALVFAAGETVQPDALEVIVHRLRRKLAGTGVEIMTLRGVGYLLCDAPKAAA